eukprot:TRINITY_DN7482_c0_g1_i9.p2 TRINITY_DN7482_c0_g1~~TRINITY_DN7482_c0_g1_i9.p2  ORF type:complete len:227 (+),score=56.58 TRINITY_DN7482_c0_g1_i9:120-800(+)
MIRRPPRSTHCISSAASDVYKRQIYKCLINLFVFLFFLFQQSVIIYNIQKIFGKGQKKTTQNLKTFFFFLILFFQFFKILIFIKCFFFFFFFFFFSSRRRHTRSCLVSWARRCVQETDQIFLSFKGLPFYCFLAGASNGEVKQYFNYSPQTKYVKIFYSLSDECGYISMETAQLSGFYSSGTLLTMYLCKAEQILLKAIIYDNQFLQGNSTYIPFSPGNLMSFKSG